MSTLLEVNDLGVFFGAGARPVRAVERVSFAIEESQSVGLVGESGCGKTVTALSLARLIPPGQIGRQTGSIRFHGEEVAGMGRRRLRRLRGGDIAYVFQEPATALNPVLSVGEQIAEAVRAHRPDEDARSEALGLLQRVGIGAAAQRLRAYPHELSGGMQQRVVIAMALACRPSLLVADEPTTALDVTIQAQILELLHDLRREFRMAVLLITHNLGLVAETTERVHVMYAGSIVEYGPTRAVLGDPRHPYTRGLLAAVPRLGGDGPAPEGIPGAVPDPGDLPPGCRFAPRCGFARDVCRRELPGFTRVGEDTARADAAHCAPDGGRPHEVRCLFPGVT